ncbi:Chitin synthase, class 3 [Puccinia graminis f. sp. tritici]|nr:Chitin synthase, class 3 [Puccinia graminis f. sp. tritici]KAA1081958.1 Chitin synthase, class 3 [Puccinia graminis f. sp. tritici]
MSTPHNHPHNRPQRQQPPLSSPFVSQTDLRPPRTAPLIHQNPAYNRYPDDRESNLEKDEGSYSPPHLDPSEPILHPTSRDNLKSGVRFGVAQSSYDSHPHLAPPQHGNPVMHRKKSLVRPDRAPIDPTHRLYNYRNHAAAMEADERGRVEVSHTGATAFDGSAALAQQPFDPHAHPLEEHSPNSNSPGPMNTTHSRAGLMAALGRPAPPSGYAGLVGEAGGARTAATGGLRRGQSILARRPGEAEESGLAILKRGETLRRTGRKRKSGADAVQTNSTPKPPISPWAIYCRAVTCCFPAFLLSTCGIKSADRLSAWREKMGILFLIFLLMAAVAFLTFGFTQTVCGKPPLRYHSGSIQPGMIIFHGETYDFDNFKHPAAPGIAAGDNPAYSAFNAGAMDGSFLFQRVNQRCQDIITPASRTGIPTDGSGKLSWYFPCNLYDQYGASAVNKTGYAEGRLCHTKDDARQALAKMKPLGQVYYTWDDLKNSSRNLVVYDSIVLDLNLLNWLDRSQVSYPDVFDDLKQSNNQFSGQDITMQLLRAGGQQLGGCLTDIIQVGYIDTNTLGCVASTVVLYASLVVIIGVVLIKWAMAVWFAWFFGWRLGSFGKETAEQRAQRAAAIETWSSDIYRPAPARYRPNARNAKKSLLPNTSRFTVMGKPGGVPGLGVAGSGARPMSTYVGEMNRKSMMAYPSKPTGLAMKNSPPSTPGGLLPSQSAASLNQFVGSQRSSFMVGNAGGGGGGGGSTEGSNVSQPPGCPFPLYNVVPQPPPDYEPFNFPLVHTICLVTAYSESVEGLRTTLDSLATTDYPNSHKFILVIADGKVKGSGNDLTTPEICLSMMKDLIVRPDEVEPKSYVAIADGHKRHNMAEVYAGFYSYDNDTVEVTKQQRVPMILISKVGNADEQHESKPGNRGKRDSQVLLMSFLQKVMFDERMTEFDYEFFNSIWRVTGVSPDHYEICLMVDADTKVFPDAVSRMAACMVRDSEIMGLCGETKIANKSDSWVTMIQVFEYYISHHLQKSFESMFGGVTCLPGCFSMYRIKAPKGGEGYWVPILANPDIVEHYSENVVDTLHAKNLLLLGEDRFLTTLMLKTFPKRKMMFCPQAVCKTIVPDTFRVLLSQRRRWINSTIHNLFELLFVRDLCGTFCFSMQFVIGMELVGTLVLPAAISFTGYIIILTIIPGTEKPIISLILLAFILGLPGLLIVITSRRIAYVGWMLVYLLSLPIWNAVLPTYAYFHMDDFTWGETRKIEGAKEKAHGDKEGEFDSSHITMKRWVEFERERRWRTEQLAAGTLNDNGSRNGTTLAPPSGRYSLNSSIDNWSSATVSDPYSTRLPSIQQLSLPQPLAREESKVSAGGHYLSNARNTMPLRQTSQDSYTGRMTDFDAREPILPAFRATNETSGHSPFEDEERVSPNHEFSHLFQSSHPDEDQQSSSHSTVLGGSGGSNGLELKAGFARGVTLSDTGAVPDSMGAMRRVDRPTHSNLPPILPHQHQPASSNPFKTSASPDDDLPSPPGFTTYRRS